MWPAIIGAAASIGGGLLSARAGRSSSARQMSFAEEQARLNREFQEQMSRTAHQRQVKDMRAAGLNPILSATGGHGASTPAGSLAHMPESDAAATQHSASSISNYVNAATSLAQAAQSRASARLIDQQAKTEKERTRQVKAEANIAGLKGGPAGWFDLSTPDSTASSARQAADSINKVAKPASDVLNNLMEAAQKHAERTGASVRETFQRLYRRYYSRGDAPFRNH